MRGCDSGGEREERSRRRDVDCLSAVLKRVFMVKSGIYEEENSCRLVDRKKLFSELH